MNFFTHVLIGLLLGAGLIQHPPLVFAVLIGSVIPDLDVLAVHRKTLHYPVYGSIAGMVLLVPAVVTGSIGLAAVALFLSAAGLHALLDVMSRRRDLEIHGDLTESGVYNHYRKEWMSSKSWFSSGSLADAAVAVGISILTYNTYPVAASGLAFCAVTYAAISNHPLAHDVRRYMAEHPVLRRFLLSIE